MSWAPVFIASAGVVAFVAALNCMRYEELRVLGIVLMTINYLLYVTTYAAVDILRQSAGRSR